MNVPQKQLTDVKEREQKWQRDELTFKRRWTELTRTMPDVIQNSNHEWEVMVITKGDAECRLNWTIEGKAKLIATELSNKNNPLRDINGQR